MIDIGSSYSAGITRSAHFKMKLQNNADGTALWKAIFWEGYYLPSPLLTVFLFAFRLLVLYLIPDFFTLRDVTSLDHLFTLPLFTQVFGDQAW